MTEKSVREGTPKKYEELTFTDDFMFCKVLTHNLNLCKGLLEIILEKKIRKVELPEAQKDIKITYDGKGIRLDVYVEDKDNTVYDIEMQATDTKNLPKRSRYYQGMIDLNLISKGEDYKQLKKSYIIFLCKFDPFEENLCCYTFENVCLQRKELKLEDESVKIFVNPNGNREGISEEQRELFRYLIEEKAEGVFTRELKREVETAKKQEEWRVEYMTLLMRDRENQEKGYHRGLEQGLSQGLEQGLSQGLEQGLEQGIQAIVSDYLSDNLTKEQIIAKLQKLFQLTFEEATGYYEKYRDIQR